MTSSVKLQSSVAKPLAVTQGDPAGVGPAASLLAWQKLHDQPSQVFYIRGSATVLQSEAKRLGLGVNVQAIGSPVEAASVFPHALPVLDNGERFSVRPGTPDLSTADSIIGSIRECVSDVWSGEADAIVTNPISKALLYAAGFTHPGHTEYLAALAGQAGNTRPPLPVMMLVGGGLRVALTTIHMPLMNVGKTLTTDLITQTGQIVIDALRHEFGHANPRLGVCGLNPHAGEEGGLGSEDAEIIRPAIEALNATSIVAFGPRPGDTIFHEALSGMYDAVLAMYHDQGLIPVKTLDIWGGVNVTLGLPFVRTSPDHGTGYEAAASGNIRADSLIAAIKLARDMSETRQKRRASHDR